jgi:hypothetical protein
LGSLLVSTLFFFFFAMGQSKVPSTN